MGPLPWWLWGCWLEIGSRPCRFTQVLGSHFLTVHLPFIAERRWRSSGWFPPRKGPAWCLRSQANLKRFRSSLFPQQGTQTYHSQKTSPAYTEIQGGKSSDHHCRCQWTSKTTGVFSKHRGKGKDADSESLALVFTSYSLIVPFHVQPLLIQTAGRLSTSRRAALSGKA